MGRTKQTTRKKGDEKPKATVKRFSSAKERFEWREKTSDRKFQSVATYKAKDRLWVVTKQPVGNLQMVDKELIVDEDGDRVYRVVHMIGKTGEAIQKYGFVRRIEKHVLPENQVGSIVDEATSKKLDAWLKSAKEDVETTDHKTGMVLRRLDLKPCNVHVPGWNRITKAEAKRNLERNIRTMLNIMFA